MYVICNVFVFSHIWMQLIQYFIKNKIFRPHKTHLGYAPLLWRRTHKNTYTHESVLDAGVCVEEFPSLSHIWHRTLANSCIQNYLFLCKIHERVAAAYMTYTCEICVNDQKMCSTAYKVQSICAYWKSRNPSLDYHTYYFGWIKDGK